MKKDEVMIIISSKLKFYEHHSNGVNIIELILNNKVQNLFSDNLAQDYEASSMLIPRCSNCGVYLK